MTQTPPRVLFITLYSGENEFEESKAALQRQSYPYWEQKVFEGLGNREAHLACYNEIVSRPQFELFIKLDADMVLLHERVLEEIVAYFADRRGLDHAVFSVRDFASETNIMGLHVFSNRVTWPLDLDTLFVDPSPNIPGEREVVWRSPSPVAHHSPNPSERQLFFFGVHRALKALQFGRTLRFRPEVALIQWQILSGVAGKVSRSHDRRLMFAIYGAELVRRRRVILTSDAYKGEVVAERFEAAELLPTSTLEKECAFWLGSKLRRLLWWCSHVGWRAGIGLTRQVALRVIDPIARIVASLTQGLR